MNITVIGAGVIGLCSAYYLQKEGYEVTVIDRGNITDGCSFGNMGYMSPSHFIPLASPGIISEGIRHMLLHADVQSRQRPGKAIDGVGDYTMAECCVFINAAIGVNEYFIDLRLEACEHMGDHGCAMK